MIAVDDEDRNAQPAQTRAGVMHRKLGAQALVLRIVHIPGEQ